MPIKNYGVLKGKAVSTKMGSVQQPHFQVLLKDDNDVNYRMAINIQSQASPSEVLYFVGEHFNSDEITELPHLAYGFTPIVSNRPRLGLDYVRGNLFDPSQMIPLPIEAVGPDNDLNDKLLSFFKQAIDTGAVIYAFGQRWGPETNQPDAYFGFLPGNGIHDIHMNQGNTGTWEKDNGTWQDGGILIHFEQENRWGAIFLAFQSQSWCTDQNGDPIKPVDECNYKNVKPSNSTF